MIPLLFKPGRTNKLVLDNVRNSPFAISTRVLSKRFLGDWLVQIRRSSDNDEAQILADLSLPIPRVSLNSPIVGSTSNLGTYIGANSGFTVAVKNQANTNHGNATQVVAVAQPRLINAGNLETIVGSSFPGFRFIQASSTFLNLPTTLYSGMTSGEIFWLINSLNDPAVGTPAFHAMGTGGENNHYPWTDGNIYDGWGTNVRKSTGNPSLSLTEKRVYNVVSRSGEWTSRIDGGLHFTTATNAVSFPSTALFQKIGCNGSNTFFFDGTIGEIIIFNSPIESRRRYVTDNLLKL